MDAGFSARTARALARSVHECDVDVHITLAPGSDAADRYGAEQRKDFLPMTVSFISSRMHSSFCMKSTCDKPSPFHCMLDLSANNPRDRQENR